MGPGEDVGVGGPDRDGSAAGFGGHDDRVGEERGEPCRGGELAGELAVDEVKRALTHEPERGDVPERAGAAVAEGDDIVLGQREEVAQAGADPADQAANGRLAVRGAQDGRAVAGETRSAAGRTFDGPLPKRPSAGFSACGISIVAACSVSLGGVMGIPRCRTIAEVPRRAAVIAAAPRGLFPPERQSRRLPKIVVTRAGGCAWRSRGAGAPTAHSRWRCAIVALQPRPSRVA